MAENNGIMTLNVCTPIYYIMQPEINHKWFLYKARKKNFKVIFIAKSESCMLFIEMSIE